MVQDAPLLLTINMDGKVLDVRGHLTNLGSTITSNLSQRRNVAIEQESNKQQTLNTKSKIYQACVLVRQWILDHIYQIREQFGKFSHSQPPMNAGITWQDRSPKTECWRKLALSACISCLTSVVCAGLCMCTEWRTVVFHGHHIWRAGNRAPKGRFS